MAKRLRLPKALADFKVRPGHPTDEPETWRNTFRVMVFATVDEMKAAHDALGEGVGAEDFGAVTMPIDVQQLREGEWVTKPSLGFMLMCKKQIDAETVAHESVHMAVAFLRRVSPISLRLKGECEEREERLAYAIGNCTRQIVEALYEAKLY